MWIDIEDAAGRRYGPITTAVEWNATSVLDAAGTFSFSMPASDPNCNLCRSKRVARAWVVEDGITKEVGAGVIDRIETRPQPNGPTMLLVSGDDLLRELTYTTVGDLELFTRMWTLPDLIEYINTNEQIITGLVPPFTINLQTDPLSYLYVEHSITFNALRFTLGAMVNTTACALKAQYWNQDDYGWQDLDLTDGTAVAGTTLAQSGVVSWSVPPGWAKYNADPYYIIRFYNNESDISPVAIDDLRLELLTPTLDALQTTMALAPANWSLDLVAGDAQTTSVVYLQMANETILATLIRIAETIGEHFALSFGRRVRWLGTRQDDSGLRAIARSDVSTNNDYALSLLALTEIKDSYPLYTRIYPTGAGIGDARLKLTAATDAAPTGYTLSTSGNYLECDAAVAEYGRIDCAAEFPYITPMDVSAVAEQTAANQLLKAAYEQLRRYKDPQYAYTLEVLPTRYELWPGQALRVVYDEWVDQYHSVAIDAVLWVLSVEQRITTDGVRTQGLTVATIDRRPQNNDQVMVDVLAKGEIGRSQPLPTATVSSSAVGVPVVVAVKDGLVTNIRRIAVIPDGRYGDFEISHGLIVDFY